MKKMSINEIKQLLEKDAVDATVLAELRGDQRKGIQRLLAIYDRKVEKIRQLEKEFLQKRAFDLQFVHDHEAFVAGVDEAGRGPLAGPVVAAAVILPDDFTCLGLDDSKKMKEKERAHLFNVIIECAIDYKISIIHNTEIDELNILEATKKAMTEALCGLSPSPSIALIDAVTVHKVPFPTKSIIKGDEKSISIAAASILAKVTRDRIMEQLDEKVPMYQFSKNKGYGTKIHLEALHRYGPSVYHRKSFSPVQKALTL